MCRTGNKNTDYIIFLGFIFLLLGIMFFHEPWFDEAQAWEIGKDASLYELFFVIPHYEGHPPFWSLILAIPARLGVPFEVGLKTIGFVITSSSVYLLIFRSPLNVSLKYALPFSFFFFYQAGVIVRPYCLMILFLLLLAYYFKQRFEHPYLYSFLLFLLCCTGAYGMTFSCGIAINMVLDIILEKGWAKFCKDIFIDRKTLTLMALLFCAILLSIQIMPVQNTYNPGLYKTNSILVCLLCTFFTILGDCFITRSLWFYYDRSLLQSASIPWYSLLSCIAIGIMIWLMIYCYSTKKVFRYFFIPYAIFAVFSSLVYFNGHHLVCGFAILLFWMWIASEKTDDEIGWKKVSEIFGSDRDRKLIERFSKLLVMTFLLVSVYWTISSCVLDIRKEFSYGRHTAEFINRHRLNDAYIIGAWQANEDGTVNHTNQIAIVVPINAYMGHNIATNLNDNNMRKGFMYHSVPTPEENEKNYAKIRKMGWPEVMIGKPDLKLVFGEDADVERYTPVYYMNVNYIWKGDAYRAYVPLLVRNDLLKKYDLEEAELPEDVTAGIFQLTDEQFRLYQEGKLSIEEIINEY